MQRIVTQNYDEMSRVAAALTARQIWQKPDSVLGLATGSTPVGMYACLADMVKAGELSFAKVKTFNLDEYYPISRNDSQSYMTFMRRNLFDFVDICPDNIHIPNGEAPNAQAECEAYEKRLQAEGPMDLQVLGSGGNGHIGFNEPDDALILDTHVTTLAQETLAANARFFANIDEVPKSALTMGMGAIFAARHILLLISGKSKAAVTKELFSGKISARCPVTLLHLHPHVTVVLDADALSDLPR